MTVVEFSVEVDASPELVWTVASDPHNLPQWDRHIRSVISPKGGMRQGATYRVVMAFMGVTTNVRAEVLEWEPPWRSAVKLSGLLEATVTTSVGSLPFDRSMLRHEVSYRFRGPLGGFAAASLNTVGGAQLALRHGVLAQKQQIEARAAKGATFVGTGSIARAAVLGAGAAAVAAAALGTDEGARIDGRLFELGNADAGPEADRAFLEITELGSLYAAGAAAGTLAALGRRRAAVRAVAAAGTTWALGQGVKRLVERPRPYEADVHRARFLIAPPRGTSWPSSHPAVFTTFATVAGRELDLGPLGRTTMAGLGVAVAASRVYVGVHYPSDVAAGLLMGRAVAALWRR